MRVRTERMAWRGSRRSGPRWRRRVRARARARVMCGRVWALYTLRAGVVRDVVCRKPHAGCGRSEGGGLGAECGT